MTLQISYTADALAAVRGGSDHKLRYLDDLEIVADVDLERIAGWRGATLHFNVLNNLGRRPNDGVGTLQGVDNIEVSRTRLKLLEFWLEQSFGENVSLLVGLYDLNSEFYANDSAGLLIGPAFGVGSEVAATGPNGPSLFPSTAPALRLNLRLGATGYARIGVFNARAGVPGDDGGVDLTFDDGVLMIGEVGIEGEGKLAMGAWRYSKRQEDLRDLDPSGAPRRRRVGGAYLLAERPILRTKSDATVTAFLRGGVSDGRTTPFAASWQAGVLIAHVVASRPDSQLSFGIAQGNLSRRVRRNQADAGIAPTATETSFELTYADRLGAHLTVQPDIQYIRHPGGDGGARDAIVPGLRIVIEF